MADQENDEDIWDSWEDMAESGELERRMEEREREHMKLRDEIDKKLFDPGVRVLVDTDSTRTQYIPQVRILRRDPGDSATVSSSQIDTSKKVHKTLAQREKEYADARARILGEAAEEVAEETFSPIKMKTEEKLPDNIIRQPSLHANVCERTSLDGCLTTIYDVFDIIPIGKSNIDHREDSSTGIKTMQENDDMV